LQVRYPCRVYIGFRRQGLAPDHLDCHLQRYLAHKKTPTPLGPPQDPRRRPTEGSAYGRVLVGGGGLVSEVPL